LLIGWLVIMTGWSVQGYAARGARRAFAFKRVLDLVPDWLALKLERYQNATPEKI